MKRPEAPIQLAIHQGSPVHQHHCDRVAASDPAMLACAFAGNHDRTGENQGNQSNGGMNESQGMTQQVPDHGVDTVFLRNARRLQGAATARRLIPSIASPSDTNPGKSRNTTSAMSIIPARVKLSQAPAR